MPSSIGEAYDLSEDIQLTLYYDGGATILFPSGCLVLDAEEVQALKRAL